MYDLSHRNHISSIKAKIKENYMLGTMNKTNPEANKRKRRTLTSLKHLTYLNCKGRNQATSNKGETKLHK